MGAGCCIFTYSVSHIEHSLARTFFPKWPHCGVADKTGPEMCFPEGAFRETPDQDGAIGSICRSLPTSSPASATLSNVQAIVSSLVTKFSACSAPRRTVVIGRIRLCRSLPGSAGPRWRRRRISGPRGSYRRRPARGRRLTLPKLFATLHGHENPQASQDRAVVLAAFLDGDGRNVCPHWVGHRFSAFREA